MGILDFFKSNKNSKLKNNINSSKIKTNAAGKAIYDELKKEFDSSLYDYIYNKAICDKTIHEIFPENIPRNIVFKTITEYQNGRRSKDISEDFKGMFFDVSMEKLQKVIRTICSISSSALEMFRSKRLGYNWYEWKSCNDKRVRSSHAYMNDVLINYDNPPSPEELIGEESIGKYNAGECFECRCYAAPVTKLDFISWPHKVFYKNKIQTMTKEEFKSIM